MILASINGHIKVLKYLVKKGGDIGAKNLHMCTINIFIPIEKHL